MKLVTVTACKERNCTRASSQLHQLLSLFLTAFSASCVALPSLRLQIASAQTSAPSPSCLTVSEIQQLEQEIPPSPERDVVTANTISQDGLSRPSLWWAKEQFDEFGGKFVTNWVAYQNQKRIDLVVNLQPWTLLDYLGRYRFVNKFGTVARDYQYDVRVCNQDAEALATYTCNYDRTLPACEIVILRAFGRDSLPVPRRTP